MVGFMFLHTRGSPLVPGAVAVSEGFVQVARHQLSHQLDGVVLHLHTSFEPVNEFGMAALPDLKEYTICTPARCSSSQDKFYRSSNIVQTSRSKFAGPLQGITSSASGMPFSKSTIIVLLEGVYW